MQLKFDHLGVVVKNLAYGRAHLGKGLGVDRWTTEVTDEVNGVRLQFGLDPANVCYEILEPLDAKSPVYSAASKNTLHHVAYLVPDLAAAAAGLARSGWARTADPKPAIAYRNAKIQFFVSPLKTITELIEAWDHTHNFELLDK